MNDLKNGTVVGTEKCVASKIETENESQSQLHFKFYSILKNEDALPYRDDEMLVVADGLGGSGSFVHKNISTNGEDIRKDLIESAFLEYSKNLEIDNNRDRNSSNTKESDEDRTFKAYFDELIAPMIDGTPDTSALWASRIAIFRFIYALKKMPKYSKSLADTETRKTLTGFVTHGMRATVKKFKLEESPLSGCLMLPTTLAAIIHRKCKVVKAVEESEETKQQSSQNLASKTITDEKTGETKPDVVDKYLVDHVTPEEYGIFGNQGATKSEVQKNAETKGDTNDVKQCENAETTKDANVKIALAISEKENTENTDEKDDKYNVDNTTESRIIPQVCTYESKKEEDATRDDAIEESDGKSVTVEAVWAGDSRCYALTLDGLKLLSIDDEAKSGAINNLFCVSDTREKTQLNYIQHKLPLPCVLLTVSDGVFDPYNPHENFLTEYYLLDYLESCSSSEQLKDALKAHYDNSFHADDATMVFEPLGFESYDKMKETFLDRKKIVDEMYAKLLRLNEYKEIYTMTPEEAKAEYVEGRTKDRIDAIVNEIVKNNLEQSDDFLSEFLDERKNKLEEDFNTVKERQIAQCFDKLAEYIGDNPEEIGGKLNMCCMKNKIENGAKYEKLTGYKEEIRKAKKCLFDVADTYRKTIIADKSASEEAKSVEGEITKILECALDRRKRWTNEYDSIQDSSPSFFLLSKDDGDKKDRDERRLKKEQIAKNIEKLLKLERSLNNFTEYNIGDKKSIVPDEPKNIIKTANNLIEKARELQYSIIKNKKELAARKKEFENAKEQVVKLANQYKNEIGEMFSDSFVNKHGFDVIFTEFDFNSTKLSQSLKDDLLSIDKRQLTIKMIVDALIKDCERISIIDSMYNANRLERFRLYFKMDDELKKEVADFVRQYDIFIKAYESLINK